MRYGSAAMTNSALVHPTSYTGTLAGFATVSRSRNGNEDINENGNRDWEYI